MANSKKRALSELDSNINPSVPPAKRQSTGDGLAGKENIPEISYKSLTKTRLCELLRDRSLPVSGTKDKLVQRLQEHDKGTMAPPSKSQQLQVSLQRSDHVRDSIRQQSSGLTTWDYRPKMRRRRRRRLSSLPCVDRVTMWLRKRERKTTSGRATWRTTRMTRTAKMRQSQLHKTRLMDARPAVA